MIENMDEKIPKKDTQISDDDKLIKSENTFSINENTTKSNIYAQIMKGVTIDRAEISRQTMAIIDQIKPKMSKIEVVNDNGAIQLTVTAKDEKPIIMTFGAKKDKMLSNLELYQKNSIEVSRELQNMKINGIQVDSMTAAAIYGNISYESGGTFSPTIKQKSGGPGRGLCQWGLDRFKKLQKRSDANTIAGQIDFIRTELEGPENKAWQKVQLASTIESKTRAFMTFYERPAKDPRISKPERRIAAARIMPSNEMIG